MSDAKPVIWVATVELRYRKVNFGQPVLQQLWRAGRGEKEWRDVPVEATE